MSWTRVKMYKVKGGKAMRSATIEGTAQIPSIGQPIIVVARPLTAGTNLRVFQSSAVVEANLLPQNAGILFKTKSGSEYLLERVLEDINDPEGYKNPEDYWIDIGGEG